MNAGSGLHLTVDALTQMTFTKPYLQCCLKDLVHLVGMHVILGPEVVGERNHWDGWCVLAESHCAIHVHGGECYVDLFSCRWFDVEVPLAFMRHRLKLLQMRIEVRERLMPAPIGGSIA